VREIFSKMNKIPCAHSLQGEPEPRIVYWLAKQPASPNGKAAKPTTSISRSAERSSGVFIALRVVNSRESRHKNRRAVADERSGCCGLAGTGLTR